MTQNKIYTIGYSEGQYGDYYTWDDENFFLSKEAAVNYLHLKGYYYEEEPCNDFDILRDSSSSNYEDRHASIRELTLYNGEIFVPPVYDYPQYSTLPIINKTIINQDYLLELAIPESEDNIIMESVKLLAHEDAEKLEDLVKVLNLIESYKEKTNIPDNVKIVYNIRPESYGWYVTAKPLVKNPYTLSSEGLGVGYDLSYISGMLSEVAHNQVVAKAIEYSKL